MKLKKIVYLLPMYMLLITCREIDKRESLNVGTIEIVSEDSISTDYYLQNQEWVKKAILEGDTIAYNQGHFYYVNHYKYSELLYIALIMANKYNYSEAYYDVYTVLSESPTGESFSEFNKKSRSIALFYLLKSYELGFNDAHYAIEEIFGKDSIPPKSSYFLYEMAKD